MTGGVVPRAAEQERRRVARLFGRAAFGATVSEIDQWTAKGYAATVEHLLGFARTATGPSQPDLAAFLAAASPTDYFGPDFAGIDTVPDQAWWIHRMATTSNPLEEKLTLYWHGHFATAFSKVARMDLMLRQNGLLRSFAAGNFRTLCNAITSDAAMLVWLDGTTSQSDKINENYGREFMELFTLGKGRYSQQDVREAARAFTGWIVDGLQNVTFDPKAHDAGVKTILGRTGKWGAADVTDIVLDRHPEGPVAAKFVAARVAAFFHRPKPEQRLVDAMALQFRNSNYEMKPMLRTLFASAEFMDSPVLTIKTPAELVAGAMRALNLDPVDPAWADAATAMGQALFNPPSVAGWRGGAAWANTATTLARYNFASQVSDQVNLDLVSHIIDGAGGNPHTTARPWMNRLGLLSLLPATQAAIAAYNKATADAGVDELAVARGILTLLLASPDYNLR